MAGDLTPGTDDMNTRHDTDLDTPRRNGCFLTTCGEPATTWLDHPDRGAVRTCRYHARKIRERLNLPGAAREEVVA